MFKWFHEYSTEINIPLPKVWNFCMNPSNWPQWIDQFESCKMEGELQTGATVKAKIKNRAIDVPILITELQPLKSCALLIKAPLFTQTSSCTLREISHEKTALIMKTSVVSLLAPFMKRFFTKRVESSNAKCLKALLGSYSTMLSL